VVRSFGAAVKEGWKPLRTIVFASWDGEEYGLVGSTEWVEEYLPWLKTANVAYLNVDVGVGGQCFGAHAAPLLNKVIREVTAQLQSPNQTVPGQTVADLWDGKIGTMGSGSDFTAFQDFAGIPSLDVRFEACPTDQAVYHYHSNYDSFYWMSKYGDPGFVYHRAMAQVLNLLTAKLAETLIIPFSAGEYADALGGYVKKVEDALRRSSSSYSGEDLLEEEIFTLRSSTADPDALSAASTFTDSDAQFNRLYSAVFNLTKAATALDVHADNLLRRAQTHIPWWKWPERLRLGFAIRKVNTQYKLLERAFLYSEGLDGRSWFKHSESRHEIHRPSCRTRLTSSTYSYLCAGFMDRI
jgi:N-acetylated-alpha-linked acidic dipeptidase